MNSRDLVAQHIANVHAFETSYDSAIPEVASTESMSTLGGDKSSPSTAADSSRPTLSRNVTGKSLASVPTNTDVDALVRILSRRTTTGGQSEVSADDYQAELEEIMGGIFGHSENDISRRKNVGVVWKHLSVPPFLLLYVRIWGLIFS
jgi:hypothetical protein